MHSFGMLQCPWISLQPGKQRAAWKKIERKKRRISINFQFIKMENSKLNKNIWQGLKGRI